MKRFKWLVLLLVVGIAVLLLVRQKKAEVADPVTSPVSENSRVEMTPAPTSVLAGPAVAPVTTPEVQQVLEHGNQLLVIVQNEQGQALEGATILTAIRVGRGSPPLTNFNRTFTTAQNGIAAVLWPK